MKYLKLFLVMLKIGLFTFGGGYAMIALIQSELVSKRKWLNDGEFADMVAIAESTPGPVAINAATYVGYKTGGFLGALIATVGVVLPSFAIIFLISLFFNEFLTIRWVAAAFSGIRVCVVFLIFSAGAKMFSGIKKSPLNLVILGATFACMLLFSLFSVNFSSVFYILASGVLGLVFYLVCFTKDRLKKKRGENKEVTDKKEGGEE